MLISNRIDGQTHEWWAQTVKWDGVTHWANYITYKPGYLGPNALPIPLLWNGNADSNTSISLSTAGHYMKGDQTINAVVSGNYPVLKNKLSADIMWVPVELFRMSHLVKEKRHVYYQYYNSKVAIGDIHFNVSLQLLNAERRKQSLGLRIGYRYPTSYNVGAARMTDAPGYFFDLSTARFFANNRKWKCIAMVGFYVWQLNTSPSQNDAFLFGAGLEYTNQSIQIQTSISGYIGYHNDGDQPIVYRLKAGRSKPGFNWVFQVQQGLNDFKYTSFEAGSKYIFKPHSKYNPIKMLL